MSLFFFLWSSPPPPDGGIASRVVFARKEEGKGGKRGQVLVPQRDAIYHGVCAIPCSRSLARSREWRSEEKSVLMLFFIFIFFMRDGEETFFFLRHGEKTKSNLRLLRRKLYK